MNLSPIARTFDDHAIIGAHRRSSRYQPTSTKRTLPHNLEAERSVRELVAMWQQELADQPNSLANARARLARVMK